MGNIDGARIDRRMTCPVPDNSVILYGVKSPMSLSKLLSGLIGIDANRVCSLNRVQPASRQRSVM
jgi:hypothetical protein